MAWDTNFALEGIFMFGGPVNVHRYEIDSGKFGQSTGSYHVIHFEIDNEQYIWERLMEKMHGPIVYYPCLYLLERRNMNDPSSLWKQENIFYRPWLFSLLKEYKGSKPPFHKWGGPALAIACDKKYNPHIHSTDW